MLKLEEGACDIMRFMNEAYVLPSITDEEAQRSSMVKKSRDGQTYAMLHHHGRQVGCNEAVKPCEKYKDGEKIEEIG